jgi:large-conductance mechanosensitive channel
MVNLKKVLTWLVVAFVIFYIIQAPENSAEIVRSAGEALGDAASSFAAFVGSLV